MPLLHGDGAAQGARRVPRQRIGGAEDGHHRVALELVDRAAVLHHDLGHGAQVTAHDLGDDSRRQALGDRREAADIAEQDPDLELLLDHRRLTAHEPVGDL